VANLYPTDPSDLAWALVSPLLPPAGTDGRRRTTDLRAVLDAIFYLLRTGWKLQIVKRRERAFKITGLTRIVERTLAWLGRNRRLSKDYEYAVQASETMISQLFG
jgi:transposase